MDESSDVKVLVRSANNLSGRSIKRKLQRRSAASKIMRLADVSSATGIASTLLVVAIVRVLDGKPDIMLVTCFMTFSSLFYF